MFVDCTQVFKRSVQLLRSEKMGMDMESKTNVMRTCGSFACKEAELKNLRHLQTKQKIQPIKKRMLTRKAATKIWN